MVYAAGKVVLIQHMHKRCGIVNLGSVCLREAKLKIKSFCIGNIEFAGLIFLHMLFGTACCRKFFVG